MSIKKPVIKKIKKGYYSAEYFLKTKKIIKHFLPKKVVKMQFFQRHNNVVLCGINEVIELLRQVLKNKELFVIEAIPEGSIINADEPVLKITGLYTEFGFLEGIIDGILARHSSIATNASKVVEAANGKIVISMADRSDYFQMLEKDGYAASLGGIKHHVTEASLNETKLVNKTIGTIPHALIQMCSGNLIEALEYFAEIFPNENLIALTDFNNDVITDSLNAANYFKNRLYGVRIDTSPSLKDKYFTKMKIDKEEYYGVNPTLIKVLRKELDFAGHEHVKIIVSSGFDENKIKMFEKSKAPVDIYGVGGALTNININFTGDAIESDGKPIFKTGRGEKNSKQLKWIKL